MAKNNEYSIVSLATKYEEKRYKNGDIKSSSYVRLQQTIKTIGTYKFANISIKKVTKKQIEDFLQNERTKEIFDVLDHVINYYKEKNIYDEYKEQLEYIYTRYLLCSSLLRMVKINDKEIREKLIEMTWTNLNTKFPNWKKNNLLKKKNKKNFYMRTLNKFTYKIYSSIFSRM